PNCEYLAKLISHSDLCVKPFSHWLIGVIAPWLSVSMALDFTC
ncbi:MAG: hypothetical protein JWM91_2264, partial [Rhodospirillales bacterium]|nr:hypothetical protein [Rhodospirillales bacterium]